MAPLRLGAVAGEKALKIMIQVINIDHSVGINI